MNDSANSPPLSLLVSRPGFSSEEARWPEFSPVRVTIVFGCPPIIATSAFKQDRDESEEGGVQRRFIVVCVLAGMVSACSAPSASPPATPAIAMADAAPGPEAKTCLWFFESSGSGQEFTAAPSSIAMSADGWCWARSSFSHHNLSFVPAMEIMAPPEHGTLAFQSGPDGLVEVGYRPEANFFGTDHATVVAKRGRFQAIYPFVMNVARPDGVFAAEPPPHGLPRGTTILVDDGTCPAGQIKHVTAGTPRKKVCMPATG